MKTLMSIQVKVVILSALILNLSCNEDSLNEDPLPEPIIKVEYREDGRKVFYGDVNPISLDINNDGRLDYAIFAVLTASSAGDHMYAGVNPIGYQQIQSGPQIEDHFLNMGFLIETEKETEIPVNLQLPKRWTSDHSILAIRHTYSNGALEYEGVWADANEHIVGIRFYIGEKLHYGWLRLSYDLTSEYITLIDYAYNLSSGSSLKAGQKN